METDNKKKPQKPHKIVDDIESEMETETVSTPVENPIRMVSITNLLNQPLPVSIVRGGKNGHVMIPARGSVRFAAEGFSSPHLSSLVSAGYARTSHE